MLEPEQIHAWGELQRRRAEEGLRLLDRELADRPFLAGEAFSFADITLVTSLEGTAAAGFEIPGECTHVRRWFEQCAQRPSIVATR